MVINRPVLLALLCVLCPSGVFGQGAPFLPDDPLFNQQWHLAKQSTGAVVDANVLPAWAQGWTGVGVLIGVVEGNFDASHPDLAPNYSPQFRLGSPGSEPHGTSVAGISAARGGNSVGGSGVAPFAGLTDLAISYATFESFMSSNAAAARHRNDVIDIKNYSILVFDVLRRYPDLEAAILESESAGTINVRIANNSDFNANRWGDKNFFGQIIVSGVGSNGLRHQNSSFGSNVFVASPTLNSGGLGITTTTAGGGYISNFSGTSAAAPTVSGVLALAKEAQPRLETRMAKHLLARTSAVVVPDDNRFLAKPEYEAQLTDPSIVTPIGKWTTNAAGLNFNNHFGFGLIDAAAMVNSAQEYTGVTELVTINSGVIPVSATVPEDDALTWSFSLSGDGQVEDMLFDFNTSGLFKTSVEVIATSPAGTTSLLQDAWVVSDSAGTAGDRQWAYLSNAFWGEEIEGIWSVTMRDLPWNHAAEAADLITWNSLSVTARSGTLIPAGPGDFDADGDADGHDFLVWQRDAGPVSRPRADDNADGVVDASDLAIWSDHYGVEGAMPLATVPEPASVTLLLLALGVALNVRGTTRAELGRRRALGLRQPASGTTMLVVKAML
jgi:hypothetical protein